ncbi:MAG: VCBS repeat-containing protein [Candidatus Omnitrophica bacterium]|nr:VCBS repeat-containing protein [Candidatus Omnitrophota bacterium]
MRTIMASVSLLLFVLLASRWGDAQDSSHAIDALINAIVGGDVEKSQSYLDALPSILSEDDSEKVVQAFTHVQPSGEWISFLEALVRKCNFHPQLRLIVARTYWRAGNIDQAILQCRQIAQDNRRNPGSLYQCAAIAQTAGRLDEAKEWLEMLLAEKPEDADGLFLMARIHASEGEAAKAEPLLQQAIQLNPKHYLAYYELGRLKNKTGDYEQAEQNLRNAVHYYPFFQEAYNALLTALARQKKTDDIQEIKTIMDHLIYWDAAKEQRLQYSFFHPSEINVKDGYELAAELCYVQRHDLARKYLEYAFQQGRTDEPFVFFLAQLRFRDGDYAGCLSLLDLLRHPRATESQTFAEHKAWSLFETGRIEEAASYLKDAHAKFQQSKRLQALSDRIQKQLEDSSETSRSSSSQADKPAHFQFVDATERAGLTSFRHVQGNPDKRWITDAMGSGLAVADYDNDGDDDVYFVNAQPDVRRRSPEHRNALFRNDGGRFVDVTDQAGVGDAGYGMCAVFGDVNNDRFPDLFVGNYGANVFYINNGDGTFTEVSHKAGLDDPGYAAAAAFADVNGDGRLDLFVGNYVDFNPEADGMKRDRYHGVDVFTGPLAFAHQMDRLYINQGDGTFKEDGREAGINVSQGRAMGCAFFDFEDDGDVDLYVSNDSTYNHVLANRGDGRFEDRSFVSGGAFNESGVAGGSMGVSLGDFNNDGLIDIYVTAYEQMSDVLYRNDGDGFFSDVTTQWGLYAPSHWLITWGSGFCDFDSDGQLDLYTADGHIYPQINDLNLSRIYKQGVSLYYNAGDRFIDVSHQSFPEGFPQVGGRGSALLDFDSDGDMDILINGVDSAPLLLENQSPRGHWLQVVLDGTDAECYGVKVTAHQGATTWTRVVDGGSSYLSQNSRILHFGFGDVEAIDRITVHWRHKAPQTLMKPILNQRLTIP